MVKCNETQFCINTVGSFQCVCRPGYGGDMCTQKGTDIGRPRLQALDYDILPSTTAVFSYAIGSRKLSANEQFFVGAQTVVNLLQTAQIKPGVSFIATNKVYTTLRASLSGTFLQTLPDLVTPLKGHSLSPRSCPPTRSAPSERFGY